MSLAVRVLSGGLARDGQCRGRWRRVRAAAIERQGRRPRLRRERRG
jgi:hypothetical protein